MERRFGLHKEYLSKDSLNFGFIAVKLLSFKAEEICYSGVVSNKFFFKRI